MNYLIDTHILLWYIVGDRRVKSDTQVLHIFSFSGNIEIGLVAWYISRVSLNDLESIRIQSFLVEII